MAESIGLDMDDIFDDRGDDEAEEDFAMPPPMPDLDIDDSFMQNNPFEDGEAQADGEGDADAEVNAKLKDLSKGAAKKKVMRPQPKLDAERLSNDRGLPVLTKLFKDVKFKGKGHEVDDLCLMMGKLEHWAHRLFPKMPFDEFIERLEKLGIKKNVQACIKRIRLDMPILDEDYVTTREADQAIGDDDDEANNNLNNSAKARKPADHEEDEVDTEADFEAMMQREKEQQRQRRGGAQAMENGDDVGHLNTPGSKTTTLPPQTPVRSTSATPTGSEGSQAQSTPSASLSAEQQAKIERNRQLAMEKRRARLGLRTPAKAQTSKAPDNPEPGTSSQGTSLENNVQPSSQETSLESNVQPSSQGTCKATSEDNSESSVVTNAIGKQDLQTEDEIMSSLLMDDDDDDMDLPNMPSLASRSPDDAQRFSEEAPPQSGQGSSSDKDIKMPPSGGQELGDKPEAISDQPVDTECQNLRLKLSVSDSETLDTSQSDLMDANSTLDSVMEEPPTAENPESSPHPQTAQLDLQMTVSQSENIDIVMSETEQDSNVASNKTTSNQDTESAPQGDEEMAESKNVGDLQMTVSQSEGIDIVMSETEQETDPQPDSQSQSLSIL